MKTRKLGNFEISAVGLGCMGFSHAYGEPIAESEAIASIRSAYDMGYTFLTQLNVILEQIRMEQFHIMKNSLVKP